LRPRGDPLRGDASTRRLACNTRAPMLAQLSDPHIRVGPDDRGSAAALGAAVRSVLALEPAPDAVLVSGDLADGATEAEYARVRELLAPLPMPVHVIAGNHDDPAAIEAMFGSPPRYAVPCGPLRLVALDSTRPGRDDGRLDAERCVWLAEQLAADRSTPTIVAMHHPPLAIGIPVLDDIALPAGDRRVLGGILADAPQARVVAVGHVHRAVFGVLAGRAVVACPSVWMQSRLRFGATRFEVVDEPPAFAVHALVDGEIVSHLQPVTGS
jgi:3',5'-cyclic-AMP phosphodiesterase